VNVLHNIESLEKGLILFFKTWNKCSQNTWNMHDWIKLGRS